MIEPVPPRATIEHQTDALRITIPAQRQRSLIFSLAVWLCGWAVGEVVTIARLLNPQPKQPDSWFLIVWLVVWTWLGVYFASVLLWTAFGREVIEVGRASLAIRKQTPVFTRARAFDLTRVRGLRVATTTSSVLWDKKAMMEPWKFTIGGIAFDCGAKTYRFGSGVDEAEAKQLVATIVHSYPSLASQRGH